MTRDEPTTLDLLLARDWSKYTVKEIAKEIGRSENTIYTTIRRHRNETGFEIPHRATPKIIDRVLAMNCKDMTIEEIAAKLGENQDSVETALYTYRKRTGLEVPHKRLERKYPKPESLLDSLLSDDWSDLPSSEIAWTLGVERTAVVDAFRKYKKRTGKEIPHAKEPRRRKGDE